MCLNAAALSLLLSGAAVSVPGADAHLHSEDLDNTSGRLSPPRVYTTARLQGSPPDIDGKLDDRAWLEGEWSGDYVQRTPNEGAPPSQRTELKILYDDRNVYVAIRAYDDPDEIYRYPTRRDTWAGDVVGVAFDSYFDKRTGFEFNLNAAGSKMDAILGNEEFDTSWDAVWYGKVGMEEDAWTAEFQIPLSQLRYGSHQEQVWGLHSFRWIARNSEELNWNLVPRQNTGFMHNIGELHGIRDLPASRRIELLPHVLGEVDSARFTADNQVERTMGSGSAGIDAKVGLSSNFTLDATVNPDFGQVEADPSVINLTAFETFFEEKRPFFLEGKKIFEFGLGEAAFDGADLLYYSRRIGAAPALIPSLSEGEFTGSPPAATTILTALKVTGKTRNGLSVGLVQSLSAKETVTIAREGQERSQVVEPYTNYLAGRVQKDWNQGNTILGGMVTSTHRWISDPALLFLPEDAVSGGLDFSQYFANRSWVVQGKGVFSHVSGDPESILELQTGAVHYFQRPDAPHLQVDPGATSLSGHGGLVRVGRSGNSKWRFSNALRWISPGLELNDLGFLRQADLIRNDLEVGYGQTVPWGPFRWWFLGVERQDVWDYGELKVDETTGLEGRAELQNKWRLNGSLRWHEPVDTRLLRGGPAMRLSPFLHWSLRGSTDPSSRFWGSLGLHGHAFADGPSSRFDLSPGGGLRITNAFSVLLSYNYSRREDDLQYVDTPETGAGPRWVMGRIDQSTHNITLRLNVNLTPDLSIQYYGSPFVSSGRYVAFKKATDTLAPAYDDRFHLYGSDEIRFVPETNTYLVQEAEGGPGSRYSFDNPDFSFREFRSNLVLRWEYRPGSSLYVVWSQGRTSDSDLYEDSYGQNFDALWRSEARNVFLVKLQHWFSM